MWFLLALFFSALKTLDGDLLDANERESIF